MVNHNKALIYVILLSVLLENLFIDLTGIPSAVRYLNDGIILLLLICCFRVIYPALRRAGAMCVVAAILFYSLTLISGWILNGGSPMLALWAIRNTYRFFAFYVICVCILSREDIICIFELFRKLQYFNLAACLYEYFILGKTRDYLGGMFGVEKGCNAYLHIYLCIVLIYVIYRYLGKKASAKYVFYVLFSTMLIAGLAELKIIFLEIGILFLAVWIMNREKRRIWVILIFGFAAVAAGLFVLMIVAPEHFQILTDLSQLMEYANSEDGGYHLSRFHALANINQLFFHGDWMLNLFGLGFGNCEYSSFSFLQSPFYREYGVYNYRWFSHQMLFLESGYMGLISYTAIFIVILLNAWRSRRGNKDEWFIHETVVIVCLITIINIWYDASLRSECAYMIWFVLAATAIVNKTDRLNSGMRKADMCREGTVKDE